MPLTLTEFVRRWKIASLSERSSAQTHFINICEMLGQPQPAEADPTGERYTFEKAVSKVYGGYGFADVWLRDHFAWEYKRSDKKNHKDLKAAYKQLNDYREDLLNPPLLVVCDLNRFEVHTNFTSTSKRTYAFDLSDLERNQPTATCPLPPLEVLRALFGDTNALRPNRTDAFVTQEAAKVFARLAERLEIEKRSHTDAPIHTKEEIAHFLMRLLFCLFADSIGLLPQRIFRNLLQSDDRFLPRRFLRKLRALFDAMSNANRDFDTFGEHTIKYFNGGLFDSSSIIELDTADLAILHEATRYNWAHVAPEIFGTLFERSLNAERRSLIGAHYTAAEDILLLIEPVLMRPLERRWAEVQNSILTVLSANGAASSQPGAQPQENGPVDDQGLKARLKITAPPPKTTSLLRSNPRAEALLATWLDELTSVRVLDPACGSGNFLYLALRRLLDLWLEAQRFAARHDISLVLPRMVSPTQLYGIETEFYAHELASIVVWIGFLQWKHEHGIIDDREPILQKLDNIQHADAILRYNEKFKSLEYPNGSPYEPTWPSADFIIGNPPFLGGKSLRRELGDRYVDDLFELYQGRVKAESDLVIYWFEKSRAAIETGLTRRAGLLATQSIRQGANRTALARIKETGNIFFAWSDRSWDLNGAAVRISMVGFDSGEEETIALDGTLVEEIHSNLSAGLNLTEIEHLAENDQIAFQGPVKVGKFELEESDALKMLRLHNVNGKPNSDVLKPWFNGGDITDRPSHRWIIDFGKMSEHDAAFYEGPFEYLRKVVMPKRLANRDRQRRENWWQLGRSGGNLKEASANLQRIIVTSRVSKHRFFIWAPANAVPDTRVVAIANDSDYMFGMLHSSAHQLWFHFTSSRHGVGNDPTYNPSTCFDTFPFPYPPNTEPSETDSPIVRAIADAARELVRLRDAWLNPPNASEADLKDRTLTKLYNARPAWLDNAHKALDEAVFAAYGWPSTLTDQEILARLLALNHQRAAAQS
jgi:type II restriction/modification system DNA methylase subunit YeeA